MFDRPGYEDELVRRAASGHGQRTRAKGSSSDESSGPTTALLRLQRAVGNAVTTRLVQAKLEVGAAGDPLEAEADRVAGHVVQALRSPEEEIDAASVSPAPTAYARRADDDGHDTVVGLEGGVAPDSTVEAISRAGSGHPLPDTVRRRAGEALGADLSEVRVHTGPSSDQAARELGATAFTHGTAIHFAKGAYDPGSASGQELLGHELTHVVQQSQGRVARSSTQRQVIRRMPSPAAVKARTGKEEKKGTKFFGKRLGATSTFNAFMEALRDHSNFIVKTAISVDPGVNRYQVDEIHRLIDRVVKAASAYLAKSDTEPEVADICATIVQRAPEEKSLVSQIGAKYRLNPFNIPKANWNDPAFSPKWFTLLPDDPRKVTASGGGGTGKQKEVVKATNAAGTKGYFAEDGKDGDYSEMKDVYGDRGVVEFQEPKFQGAQWMLEDYGQTDTDLKLGARSIAMSRLDTLLKGGVIARTERGLLGDQLGTFQWEAKGKAMNEAYAKGESMDDPELARLLSRLQLIDAIAGQVDRHAGNYFVERDKSGKVVGVTGIDLDMSFLAKGKRKVDVVKGSRNTKTGEREDWFPGFSRYVDREMAETIIALDPKDLQAVLADLLTPEMIEGAVERLIELQDVLRDLKAKKKLLEPNQWQNVLTQIKAERHDDTTDGALGAKSYYGRDVKS